ncbi:MAG TPA: anti-sigma factor antagonist [Pseudonocardiaceae bacterium]
MKPAGDERTPDGAAQAETGPPREQLMSTSTDERADAVVLLVEGEIDGLTAPRLRAAIDAAFERLNGRVLVLDLTQVEFLGSAGLRALLDSAAEAMRLDGYQPLRVVVDENRPVVRPIEIVGLDNVLALYDSVSDALAA